MYVAQSAWFRYGPRSTLRSGAILVDKGPGLAQARPVTRPGRESRGVEDVAQAGLQYYVPSTVR